ncbi:MAG: MaoC family dehydratase N-terminal domain-containing protein [Rhizobiaceae bacterium]|nr:MaoC family dehydratase N-terminal domain-containing protein [Rhizobiaceae bacterium]
MIDANALLALEIPPTEQRWSARDCALYALGVGLGSDPLDPRQLRFLDGPYLQAAPTMAVVLGYSGFWIEQQPTGIDASAVLHGEQRLELHRPLPSAGHARRVTRPTGVVDRGSRGAQIFVSEAIEDADGGAPLATLSSSIFCRRDGGCGSTREAPPPRRPLPQRAADLTFAVPTLPQQALIYRLSGDLNPLHSDPAFARAAGFERPILHGLASFGIAGMALLGRLCDWEVSRFRALDVRFAGIVFPGEALEIDAWRTGQGEAMFRASTRRGVALDAGVFGYAA